MLRFIAGRLDATGAAPSIREMQHHLGFGSIASVHRQLGHLEQRGLIKRLRGKPRAVRLTGACHVVRVPDPTLPQLSNEALWQECVDRGLVAG